MRAKSEAGQQPELSQGTRKLSELSAGVENRPNFLQRVAQAFAWTRTTHPRRPSASATSPPQPSPSRRRAQDSERRRARSWGGSQLGVSASSRGFAEAAVPTHEATDCTFAPQINGDARARRPRTVDELSAGDAQRRSQAQQSSSSVRRRRRPRASRLAGDQRGLWRAESTQGFLRARVVPRTGPSAYGTEGESDRVRARGGGGP